MESANWSVAVAGLMTVAVFALAMAVFWWSHDSDDEPTDW